jgi:hypothetical protein
MKSSDFAPCIAGIAGAAGLLAGCADNPGAVPVASGAGNAPTLSHAIVHFVTSAKSKHSRFRLV